MTTPRTDESLTVDEAANAAYLLAGREVPVARTVCDVQVNVDLDDDGNVVGVEFLSWPLVGSGVPTGPETRNEDDMRADERRLVVAEADRIIGAIATGHWINANTAEAQEHKRMVRDLVAALSVSVTPAEPATTGERYTDPYSLSLTGRLAASLAEPATTDEAKCVQCGRACKPSSKRWTNSDKSLLRHPDRRRMVRPSPRPTVIPYPVGPTEGGNE